MLKINFKHPTNSNTKEQSSCICFKKKNIQEKNERKLINNMTFKKKFKEISIDLAIQQLKFFDKTKQNKKKTRIISFCCQKNTSSKNIK